VLGELGGQRLVVGQRLRLGQLLRLEERAHDGAHALEPLALLGVRVRARARVTVRVRVRVGVRVRIRSRTCLAISRSEVTRFAASSLTERWRR
jgi:hypothetical protein